MSTIKSSDEHLTLNADGSSKDIKFQANGVEKASISSSGAFTSTTIDATKLTGNLPAISGASLTNLPSKGKNLIINGAMRVQQRGTASVASGYFVDRFQLSGCSASAVLTSSTPTEFPTAISVSATSGNPIVIQKIESENCQHLSGQTVTASFYAKNISNATTLYAKLSYAGSADNFGSSTTISEQNLGALSGSWVKYTASWTVPSGGLNGLSLNILCAGTSTFTMGVTGVQLEVGSVATDFEHRSYGEELALCQRYFERFAKSTTETVICLGQGISSTSVFGRLPFPTEKRVVPSGSVSSAGHFEVLNGGASAWSTATGASVSAGNGKSMRLHITGLSGMTAGGCHEIRIGNASGYVDFDSEL